MWNAWTCAPHRYTVGPALGEWLSETEDIESRGFLWVGGPHLQEPTHQPFPPI